MELGAGRQGTARVADPAGTALLRSRTSPRGAVGAAGRPWGCVPGFADAACLSLGMHTLSPSAASDHFFRNTRAQQLEGGPEQRVS